ncbi:MAG TPA: HNH endonuclease [Bradyrhizobium sp.]|nr:HNH endonuclease [Bradyrhizobium sp.]
MSHGHTRIPTRGQCIYCGATGVRLTDEHVVPLALGGAHILEGASCDTCANVTKKFEQDVARELWGAPRISYNAPSRRKKNRPSHIILSDPERSGRTVKVPYSEYPAAMVFYKMSKAGLLEGLPENVDVSSAWRVVAICDQEKSEAFIEKYGMKVPSSFRHVPESFARMLAKIGYCNLLTMLEPGAFRPICLPYILGIRSNPSFVVGGTLDDAPPDTVGYRLRTAAFGSFEKLMLVAEIRLFSNNGTPIYHVVVGDVTGRERVASVLDQLGATVAMSELSDIMAGGTDSHWSPRIWPLPFWSAR